MGESLQLNGEALQAIRKKTALTQKQVARQLGVPRELVSMWENGTREPTSGDFEALSEALSVPKRLLRGEGSVSEWDRSALLSMLPSSKKAKMRFERWLTFLDEWARFLEMCSWDLAGPGKPPRPLDQGSSVIDARRAPTLADEVRDHYGLGRNALPALWTFLDEYGMLTCRAALGPLHKEPGVAGVFYNHESLGFCVLVNASASPGRQTFAMAHAYAHAIFHYVRRGIVCKRGATSEDANFQEDHARVERFANAFASHFLVPRKKLRSMVRSVSEAEEIDPYKALHLASHFRVSYPTILRRLLAERHISEDDYAEMRRYSPSGLAERIGLHPWHFRVKSSETLGLSSYSLSVLEQARRALESNAATLKEVASVLQVGEEEVQSRLLTDPPEATAAELREYEEFPV